MRELWQPNAWRPPERTPTDLFRQLTFNRGAKQNRRKETEEEVVH